ncbi:uncharacterized protein [Rutidosis leptorrhynchoides]|uniref:uncharacterized protein n=1 Tax=Rutidosis leptorrhynchoides TaxID=125765 RepID=UPI003A99DCA1
MVQTLEAIKGGGGSIKVGTTGTINALMSRELKSDKVASPRAVPFVPKSPKRALEPNATTTSTIVTNPKEKLQADEASTSCSNNDSKMNEKHASVTQKMKHHHARKDSRNPFLRCDSTSVDENGTPSRKNHKKRSCMVEIVDVKCGVPANPITNRLKKLTFLKLFEANGVK